ncbi:transposase [Maribellus maritimus]|uniref:transposase n=1 Tax=Maribellus maritimus TaxID=2870838 RepID=UPI001EEAE3CE|nr:transposase [Maribellus maritimus]MCG6190255.1 transposase [Maribellus maritimus]
MRLCKWNLLCFLAILEFEVDHGIVHVVPLQKPLKDLGFLIKRIPRGSAPGEAHCMSEHITKWHNRALLLYHVVCQMKYRRNVITEEVGESLKKYVCKFQNDIKYILWR